MNFMSKVYKLFKTKPAPVGTVKGMEDIYNLLAACGDAKSGELSSRQLAAEIARIYKGLDEKGRHDFLRLLAFNFGPDAEAIGRAHAEYMVNYSGAGRWKAEAGLRQALFCNRERILTRMNSGPDGVKFLVDIRKDLLKFLKDDKELEAFDEEMKDALGTWFDVSFLELIRLTWSSPAELLEKIIEYEAVHAVHSWNDLKNRLDSDRRCYAFIHPRMPTEPLIFVQVALTEGLASNVQRLLDENAPVFDAEKANTAIFYSISNTQDGLRGISFGSFLLKRVVANLMRDFPKLKTFSTLSPMPLFMRWLKANPKTIGSVCYEEDWVRLAELGILGPKSHIFEDILEFPEKYVEDAAIMSVLKDVMPRVAAHYLLEAKRGNVPYDPVARFHLGNGARVERINWMGDSSPKGMGESWGLMVNYLYDPERLEENIEAYTAEGKIDADNQIKKASVLLTPQQCLRARTKARLTRMKKRKK
jgi:malonyl-CoA decarboxylase